MYISFGRLDRGVPLKSQHRAVYIVRTPRTFQAHLNVAQSVTVSERLQQDLPKQIPLWIRTSISFPRFRHISNLHIVMNSKLLLVYPGRELQLASKHPCCTRQSSPWLPLSRRQPRTAALASPRRRAPLGELAPACRALEVPPAPAFLPKGNQWR